MWRWVAAAAAVVVLAGVVGAVRMMSPQPGRAVDPAAALTLDRAANAAVQQVDPVLPPGYYLRLTTRSWDWNTVTHTQTDLQVGQLWVPADRQQDWRERINDLPVRIAACGDFTHSPPSCADATITDWARVSAAALAALPREPDQLLAELRGSPDSTPVAATTDSTAFLRAVTLLSSGLAPAALRAALYRAMGELPGVTVIELGAGNWDKDRVAIALADRSARYSLFLNPHTGDLVSYQITELSTPDSTHEFSLETAVTDSTE